MADTYIQAFRAAAFAAMFAICLGMAGAAEASWLNSDIAGSVKADEKPSLKDDFHRAVNHEWLIAAKIRPGESAVNSFSERADEVEAQIKKLLADKSLKSHEAALAQRFHAMLLDWKSRDKLGLSPVMPHIARIEAIKDIDGLTAYLTDASIPHFGTVLTDMGVQPDNKDASNNTVGIWRTGLLLRDADEYRAAQLSESAKRRKAANDSFIVKLLQKAGYDKARAEAMNDAHFRVEKKIAEPSMGIKALYAPDAQAKLYNVRTRKELEKASPRFPLAAIADAQGYGASREFVLGEPKWLDAMNELYRPENLEDIKNYLIVRTLVGTAGLTDSESRRLSDARGNAVLGTKGSLPDDKYAYEMVSSYLGEPIGKLYVEKYVDKKTKSDIEEVIAEVVDYYRKMLKGERWLTEKTREKAIKKLDTLTVRAAYPDKWHDYSGLDFKGIKDGGSLVDAAAAISKFERARDAKKVNTKVDRTEWLADPQMVNAYYSPQDNSINIPAGILGGVFYKAGGPVEERLGGIGMVIGHEITHAFDTNGSQYDEKGNFTNWWTKEDNEAFAKRAKVISDYFSTLEAFPGVHPDGELILSEAIADLGGASCMAAIGRGVKDFDFQKFFKAYARNWRLQTTKESEEYRNKEDVHPLAFMRTNAVVQQMPDFYEAFKVTPQDGMYLAPEKRVALW
ncbi:MAG: M13 family metallopeptidase [Cloacibacillus sp.]